MSQNNTILFTAYFISVLVVVLVFLTRAETTVAGLTSAGIKIVLGVASLSAYTVFIIWYRNQLNKHGGLKGVIKNAI